MKPGYTVSLSRPPRNELEELGVGSCLQAMNACFTGLRLNLPFTPIPRGLECLLSGDKREKIAHEVSDCSRMVAFVTFHFNQTSLEINFSHGKDLVKSIVIMYDYDSKYLVFSGDASF
jgi:hypothetical protein